MSVSAPRLARADALTVRPVEARDLDAVIALDAGTGAVRAMVGGREPRAGGFNRAIAARRQPGPRHMATLDVAGLHMAGLAHLFAGGREFGRDGRMLRRLRGLCCRPRLGRAAERKRNDSAEERRGDDPSHRCTSWVVDGDSGYFRVVCARRLW